MKSLTEHNTSYSFYEKVADDMLKKMDVFEQIILNGLSINSDILIWRI